MSRKLVITVNELPGLGLGVTVEGKGFNHLEIAGILEHTKTDVLRKMTAGPDPNGDRMSQFLGMIAGMASYPHDDDQN